MSVLMSDVTVSLKWLTVTLKIETGLFRSISNCCLVIRENVVLKSVILIYDHDIVLVLIVGHCTNVLLINVYIITFKFCELMIQYVYLCWKKL